MFLMEKAFRLGDYEQALNILDSNKEYQKVQNRLLYYLEKGTILFEQKKHTLSALSFQKAKEILEGLYTKSLSKKAMTLLTNDNADIYYGENYEKSLLHFYQAVNFASLYKQEPQNQHYLMKARAEIVSWNTLLENLQYTYRDQNTFKNDLMAKLFGAIVHEEVSTASDRQISLQLYKDAYNLLEKSYVHYESFSSNTGRAEVLKSYIRAQILRLTKIIRPYELDKIKKDFSITQNMDIPKKHNLTILLKRSFISKKMAEKQHFSLGHAINSKDSSTGTKFFAGISSLVLTSFAANKLGLLPPPQSWTPLGGYLGYSLANSFVKGVSIDFELPVLKAVPEKFDPFLILKTKDGKEFLRHPLVLGIPLDDMAEESILQKSSRLYVKTGIRLALKHLTAIAASYGTYSLMKGKNEENDFFARNAALIQYMAASKAIDASEKADIRQWRTLPKSFWILDTFVPEGEYHLFLLDEEISPEEKFMGEIAFKNDDSRNFLALTL